MSLMPLKIPPGLASNGTAYETKGRWFAGNFIRFFSGALRPIGGWVSNGSLSTGAAHGVPRAMYSWSYDAGGLVSFATGTCGVSSTAKLLVNFALTSGINIADVTPASNPPVNAGWDFDNFGKYLLAISTDTFGSTNAWVWDGDVTHKATAGLTGAPSNPISVVVTPERFVTLLGGDDGSGNDVFRTVYWADQESLTTWTPLVTNQAGSFPLATQGTLVCGRRGKGETLIWTTDDLWRMTYIGGTLVYAFQQAGQKCGIVSSHAVVGLDSRAMWMGNGSFYAYNGYVQTIPCDVNDAVFGNMNPNQLSKVWAVHNPTFSEVTWFYPSASATECDSYVTFNYVETHWVTGTLTRSCGCLCAASFAIPAVLMMAKATGGKPDMYIHESGTSFNGEGFAYIESGPVELGNGDQLMNIERLIPDEANLGDVLMTLYARNRPMGGEQVHGPYTMRNEPANVRVKARQVRVRYTQFDPTLLLPTTTPFKYIIGDPFTRATFTRATVARFVSDGNVADNLLPPHSGNWRVGTMRLGVTASSGR